MAGSISIRNLTRASIPRLPFPEMKRAILGEDYELSLVFIGDARSRKLNFYSRKKDKPTNVLSFPLRDDSGEIFINLRYAQKEAAAFGMTERGFIGYLFIHGLLHLKGYAHGSTMTRKERDFVKRFSLR